MSPATATASAPLPVLGEPLPVELANSLYTGGSVVRDFLEDARAARRWFAAAPQARSVAVPRRFAPADLAALRALRTAVRGVLVAVAEGQVPPPACVSVVNANAHRDVSRLELALADGRLVARDRRDGSEADAFLSDLAYRCIRFLTGESVPAVRRCARPGCPMLFVRDHGRRRFCHDTCSHRSRQARYRGRDASR